MDSVTSRNAARNVPDSDPCAEQRMQENHDVTGTFAWKREIMNRIGSAAASLYYASAQLRTNKDHSADSEECLAAAADILERLAEGVLAVNASMSRIQALDRKNGAPTETAWDLWNACGRK